MLQDPAYCACAFSRQKGVLRSEPTRRQVAVTRCDDTSQRQIPSCVLENFCENLCLRNRILSQQQVAQNQIKLNLWDLLRRQNSVAETKICIWIHRYTRSDLSLRRVVQLFAASKSQQLIVRRVHTDWLSPRSVCSDMSPSVYQPLNFIKSFWHQKKKGVF